MTKSLITFRICKLYEQIYIHLKEEIKPYLMSTKSHKLNDWIVNNYVQYIYLI